jgi:hypothetical protein
VIKPVKSAWFNSVQWFQRRRFKCEKLMDGQRTLSHDKSSHGLWPGELKSRDESGTQPDIAIEYENTLLHDLGILMNKSVF